MDWRTERGELFKAGEVANRVDNTVVYPDGYSRQLTYTERLTLWLAKRCNARVSLDRGPWNR